MNYIPPNCHLIKIYLLYISRFHWLEWLSSLWQEHGWNAFDPHLKSNQIIEIIWHSTDRSSRISTISKAYETETLAQYVNGQFTFPLIFGAYLCSHLFRLSRCNLLPLSLKYTPLLRTEWQTTNVTKMSNWKHSYTFMDTKTQMPDDTHSKWILSNTNTLSKALSIFFSRAS